MPIAEDESGLRDRGDMKDWEEWRTNVIKTNKHTNKTLTREAYEMSSVKKNKKKHVRDKARNTKADLEVRDRTKAAGK